MSDSLRDSLHQDGAIAIDLPCTSCGYNLRGLLREGICPECTEPIERACKKELLRFAAPDWGRSLRYGIILILSPYVLGVLTFALVFVAPQHEVSSFLYLALPLVAGGMHLWGLIILTCSEPHATPDTSSARRRAILCGLGAVSFLAQIVHACFSYSVFGWGEIGLRILHALLSVGIMIGQLHYLRTIALRVPAPRVAQHTATATWGSVICLGAMLFAGFVADLDDSIQGVLLIVFFIGDAAFAIWYFVLLVKIFRMVGGAAELARRYSSAVRVNHVGSEDQSQE